MPSIGSGGAIAAVADRAVDVGLASRPLRTSESERGVTAIPWARCEFRPVARRNRPRQISGGIDFEQVLGGGQRVWSDGSPIVFVMRERGDSGQRVLRATFANVGDLLDAALRARSWPIVTTDQELVEAVRTIPGAFGYLDAATLELSAPDLREIPGAPSVRLARTYFLLLGPDPSPEASGFVDFATSEEHRGLLDRAGCTTP
jgi:phosphate transport system substrate-binding protein